MAYLRDNEIAALRWLEREFPISPTPRFVDWEGVVKELCARAELPDEKACEAMIESMKQRGYFEGGRAMGGMFRGSITIRGQEFLRGLEAQEAQRRAQGSLAKRFARYVASQSGPIVIQAIVGIIIGVLIGWITGTVQSAVITGVASATAAGRVPPFHI